MSAIQNTSPKTSRNNYLVAGLIWVAVVLIFFWPVVFQGKILAPLDILDSLLQPWATSETVTVHNAFTYDAISQYLPYDWSVYQSLRQDGYIGWNPYTHSGASIVENTMICPGDWHHQLYRFLPFWTAWNLGIVLQFTIAGIGMLLLLRSQGLKPLFAMVGMISFAFYSQNIIWIYHRWVLGAMCWSPWIVWALLRARKNNKALDIPSIIFTTLAFRGGHLQACVFVVLLVATIAMSEWLSSENKWNLKTIFRIITPYAITGIIATVFSLDVFFNTIPPYLSGGKDMTSFGWIQTLSSLPTLITTFFPTCLGTPQSIDLFKVFKTSLFDVKFGGATIFILSLIALFNKNAPPYAKSLYILGIIIPFTPATNWLYSRVTVVFAIGMAWLAVWYLSDIAKKPKQTKWKRIGLIYIAVVLAWLLISFALNFKHASLSTLVNNEILKNLPDNKLARQQWMLNRGANLIESSKIWYPRNIITLALLGLGLFSCSRIHTGNKRVSLYVILITFCTFGEIYIYSRTWITFSEKPSEKEQLYADAKWADQIKSEMGNGTILLWDRSDFDYMQLNTPSAYDIRFVQGYETVTPLRITIPVVTNRLEHVANPEEYAASGISHILMPPSQNEEESFTNWEKIIDNESLILYRNPAFDSIYHAFTLESNSTSLYASSQTPNTRNISFPAGTLSIDILESYNPGWRYSIDGKSWHTVQKTDVNAMRIALDKPTSEKTHLQLKYTPTYQRIYRPLMFTTALFILIQALRTRKRYDTKAVV